MRENQRKRKDIKDFAREKERVRDRAADSDRVVHEKARI